MPLTSKSLAVDGTPVIRLESDFLKLDVAPEVGGRVISLLNKKDGQEFLWRNESLSLRKLSPGSEYDPNFYGGIDELIPNDIPETINGIDCPDHGELWTTALEWQPIDGGLELLGRLPRFGLSYQREIVLRSNEPVVDLRYRLSNAADRPRQFLWKLHAALKVSPGDVLQCPAKTGQVVDPAWSRFKTLEPFAWPHIEGKEANVVPVMNGTMDFFYLSELVTGQVSLQNTARGAKFVYRFDTTVFPYAWIFASYGGFNGHYTVILEPCTAMPISVNEAAAMRQCSVLEPQQTLETSVSIYVGPA